METKLLCKNLSYGYVALTIVLKFSECLLITDDKLGRFPSHMFCFSNAERTPTERAPGCYEEALDCCLIF